MTETQAAIAPKPTQVPVLTKQIKLEIVKAVRQLISDESRWMPGRSDSTSYAYAAKLVDGKPVTVQPTNPEATQFSLFGAVLLEFDRRNVTTTARGRKEFLDTELVKAIQTVLHDDPSKPPVSESTRPPLTHEQSLAVLDELEKSYAEEIKEAKAEIVEQKVPNIRLSNLVSKLEKKAPIQSEEVAAALCHEIEEIRERLAKLEKAGTK
jgi:polyhydroxyalkanoate synthesis regulator phasin